MRITPLSDLHFEFHPDGGKEFVESLNPDCDVLVLAGDITTQQTGLQSALSMFSAKFKKVLYVLGNHEFYNSNRGKVNDALARCEERKGKDNIPLPLNDNFEILRNKVVELDGKRILGTTLWYRQSLQTTRLAPAWSDFHAIQGFQKWVYEENEKAINFLTKEMREGDIVITHFLPSEKSVHRKYANDVTNCFFVCDMEPLILEKKPALWIHGHTHKSMDYKIGDTRVVCNPKGYYGSMDLNPEFNKKLVIEI